MRVLLLLLTLSLPLAAHAQTRTVQFPSAPPQANVTLTGPLTKPAGAGPFPSAILLHGGGGLDFMPSIGDYQRELTALGFVTLTFDSFKPRGVGPIDRTPLPQDKMRDVYSGRILDAYGAAIYLSTLPEVDKDRIVVMGFSDGGRVALHVAAGVSDTGTPSFDPARFVKAAVGYYPVCFGINGPRSPPQGGRYSPEAASPAVGVTRPFLIHLAGRDDWPGSEPEVCSALWERLKGPVEKYLYPEATHTFDDPRLAGGRKGPLGVVGYHKASADLAWTRTVEFLRRSLDLPAK